MKRKILFFASGDFPVKTFKSLLEKTNSYDIVGLVTSFDKHTFKNTNIERLGDIAIDNNIPTLIPETLESDETYEWIKDKKADIFCVISYKKLSDKILSLAKQTSFNVHASILPFLRGAAPINHAIRLGFKETGLTGFILNNEIDGGKIIHNQIIQITDEDNFESLYWKLSDACVKFTLDILWMLDTGCYKLIEQSKPLDDKIFKAPKITNTYTNYWRNLSNKNISNLLRSIYPVDGLHIIFKCLNLKNDKDKVLESKIWKGEIIPYNVVADKDYITDGKSYLYITLYNTKDYVFSVKEIQLSGKKKMCIEEFLRGFQPYFNDKNYKTIIND